MRVRMVRVGHMRMRVRLRPVNVRMRMSCSWRDRVVVRVIMMVILGTMHMAVRV